MALTICTPSTPSTTKSWLILRFEDRSGGVGHDIMFLNDPTEPLHSAASSLEETLFVRFNRVGDRRAGYKFRIGSLSIPGPDSCAVQVTMLHLVTYLRDLPPSLGATKPNLWGLGGHVLRIGFESENV